jgi:hypothetical protein
MAHFAQLDENNVVLQVIVVHNNELLDENGNESEAKGIAFCQNLFPGTKWVQTSYNSKFRKNFGVQGSVYDLQRDAFITPQTHPLWVLDENTCKWKPPTPRPSNGGDYVWDGALGDWKLVKKIRI